MHRQQVSSLSGPNHLPLIPRNTVFQNIRTVGGIEEALFRPSQLDHLLGETGLSRNLSWREISTDGWHSRNGPYGGSQIKGKGVASPLRRVGRERSDNVGWESCPWLRRRAFSLRRVTCSKEIEEVGFQNRQGLQSVKLFGTLSITTVDGISKVILGGSQYPTTSDST